MEKFLAGQELWSTLQQLSKERHTRQMVAVPYIGQESSSLLEFHKNDVVLCALTEQNAKSGNIYPPEIRALQKQGVRVYLRPNLHAKIYLFGNKVVVCSANLSKTSRSRLDESGLLTNNPVITEAVREWFTARLIEPVTPGWLKHCEELYRPPKWGAPLASPNVDQNRRRVWIIFGRPLEDFPPFEQRYRKTGYKNAKKYLEKPKSYDIEEFRFAGKYAFVDEIKRGDLIIQVIEESEKLGYRVCPSGRVLGKKELHSEKGTPVTYLYLELPKNYRKITFDTFKGICTGAGVSLTSHRAKEIRDPVAQDIILATVAPEKLKK